jgi:hypothetical protein
MVQGHSLRGVQEESMIRKPFLLVGFMTLLILMAGCAKAPSRLEADFGNSHHLAKTNQILNPEAAKNLEPVTGMDGESAQVITERYQKDFEKPEPAVPYTLTIGTIGKK